MMDNQSKDPLVGNLLGTMAVVQRLSKAQIMVEAQRLSKDPTMVVVQHLSSASCSTQVDRTALSHQQLFNHPGDPLLIPTVQHKCNSTEDQASTVETTDS